MKRCGLYTRVSTEDQVQVKDGSLDTQEDRLRRFVSERSWVVISVYREEGRSGKDTKRPEYQRMMQDIEAGQLDAILCTRMDRLSRSTLDFLQLQEDLKKHGVAFVSLAENWDTTTPEGELMVGQRMMFAQFERRMISDRTSEKAAWRAQHGLSNGGQVLGYDNDPYNPGIRVVNEQEKQLVLLIFRTYITVNGLKRTAEVINSKGYRTKSYESRRGNVRVGKPFSRMSISRILRNPYYIGKILHKDTLYDGQHEPIVPGAVFDQVQRLLDANEGSRARRHRNYPFLLGGLVRCGDCGAHMTTYFTYNHQGKLYPYYRCTSRHSRGKDACSMSDVPAAPLEEVVSHRLIQLGKQDRTIDRLVKEAMADTDELVSNLQIRKASLAANLERVQGQIDRLVDALATGQAKSVGKRLLQLEEQQVQLDGEILEIDAAVAAAKQKAVSAQSLTESLTTFGDLYGAATPDEKRQLIQLRVNQLVWTPEEIRLALLDTPAEYQGLVESERLVAPTGFEPVLPA